MSEKIEFSDVMSQAIGTTWNNELLVFIPDDQSKRTFVAKCVYLKNNKMLIEKQNGEIALLSINKYASINLLKPKKCEVVNRSEVI